MIQETSVHLQAALEENTTKPEKSPLCSIRNMIPHPPGSHCLELGIYFSE